MIRVGMMLSSGGDWQGGTNYFKNLCSCFRTYPAEGVRLVLFTPRPVDLKQYECDAIEVQSWPDPMPGSPWGLTRRLYRRFVGYDPVGLRVLNKHRIDLLSHSTIGRQRQIDTLRWQPDFQHRALPHLFSHRKRAERDREVRHVALWGNILLSSNAAEKDFRRYFPELQSIQTHVLHFTGAAALNMKLRSRGELTQLYPVSEPYFFLPNQFWLHKNHELVLEALRLTPANIVVVCTGSQNDPRHPEYYARLMARARDAGLERRFISLGSLPYGDIVSLMHYSIAVVQPSRYEGWSTTVEEAKAMQKKTLLSNIDVHIEQCPQRGVYFSPDSVEQLAFCLTEAFRDFDPDVEAAFDAQRAGSKARLEREWIEDYAAIVKKVSSNKNEIGRT